MKTTAATDQFDRSGITVFTAKATAVLAIALSGMLLTGCESTGNTAKADIGAGVLDPLATAYSQSYLRRSYTEDTQVTQ